MVYEVSRHRVEGGRHRLAIGAALGVALLVVGAALATREGEPGAGPPVVESAETGSVRVRDARSTPAPEARTRVRLPPQVRIRVDCGDLPAADCRAALEAARRVLGGEAAAVRAVTASRSLACADALDCPPGFILGRRPVGLLVVAFVDGSPDAWFNVVEPRIRGGAGDPRMIARAVRSIQLSG